MRRMEPKSKRHPGRGAAARTRSGKSDLAGGPTTSQAENALTPPRDRFARRHPQNAIAQPAPKPRLVEPPSTGYARKAWLSHVIETHAGKLTGVELAVLKELADLVDDTT